MIPKGKSVILACVSFQWTDARRASWPAFLVQVPARRSPSGNGDIPAHGCRTAGREQRTPLFSAAEKADKTQQLSDLDARVIDELLSDPAFLGSLVEQGVQLEESGDDGGARMVGNNTIASSSSNALLSVAGEGTPTPKSSDYESVTMQVVEGLQDSVKGVLAKVSAAFESAGIYVANRAQMDTKVIQAVVDYASKQAAAGTGRLLLAASDAASPALLMMGVNTTETQVALNDSVQLLSMGIVPDSVGLSPKLLTSFKDFDDDDKRLDAAYRRQRRRRSKPLPARVLGSLPSTINKAADLAYEVEQEVKYERAGSRANKLLKPIGISLPEAKDNSFLLGRTPSGSGTKLLDARDTNGTSIAASSSPALVPGLNIMESSPEVGESTIAESKRNVSREIAARREPIPPAPDPFGVFGSFRRKGADAKGKPNFPNSGVAESKFEPALAAMLASQLDVLRKELLNCVEAVDDEVRLQERGVRAANAVLCSTEPVIAGLEESLEREGAVRAELQNVARNVQQVYVLAEMTEAVEAADTYVGRLEELSANVLELAFELEAYVATADVRTARLVTIRSRLVEARDLGDTRDGLGVPELEFSSNSLELLQSFDAEVIACQQEAKKVGGPLAVVWRESAERARDEAGHAHEHALVAACRLWEASAVDGIDQRACTVDGIRLALTKVEEEEVSPSSVLRAEGDKSMTVPSEVGRRRVSKAVGAKVWTERDKNVRLRMVKDEAARDTESIDQQADVAQVGEGTRVAYVASNDGGVQVEDLVSDVEATPGTAPPDITRVTAETAMDQNVTSGATTVDAEVNPDFGQSSTSVDAVDAKIVRDTTVMRSSVAPSLNARGTRHIGGGGSSRNDLPSEMPEIMAADTSSIEVVVDESSSYVDVEAEVEDDVSDPARVGLKFLDVSALLIEKVIFVGLPTLVSGGSLVWERVDNAINGAKGRKGWKLLTRLKKDSIGSDDTAL